jgi:hypothetical protein
VTRSTLLSIMVWLTASGSTAALPDLPDPFHALKYNYQIPSYRREEKRVFKEANDQLHRGFLNIRTWNPTAYQLLRLKLDHLGYKYKHQHQTAQMLHEKQDMYAIWWSGFDQVNDDPFLTMW